MSFSPQDKQNKLEQIKLGIKLLKSKIAIDTGILFLDTLKLLGDGFCVSTQLLKISTNFVFLCCYEGYFLYKNSEATDIEKDWVLLGVYDGAADADDVD